MNARRLRWVLAPLLVVLADCGDAAGPAGTAPGGYLRLTIVTTGVDFDDHYLVSVTFFTTGWVHPNATYLLHFVPLPDEPITVAISDIEPNCTLADSSQVSVSIPAADTVSVSFHVDCVATGRVEVRISATGPDQDADGYYVWLDSTALVELRTTDSVKFKAHPGTHRVTLSGIAANCVTDADSLRTGTIVAAETLRFEWHVSCTLLTSRHLLTSSFGDIYVRNPGDPRLYRLTDPNAPFPADPALPVWAPDAMSVAFVSGRAGNDEIHVVRLGSSAITNLTNSPALETDPAWSPDGTRIAFVSDRDGNREIYVMNADGTGQTRLTFDPAPDNVPTWSADGLHLAFLRGCRDETCTEYADVYLMSPDGSGATPLTSGRLATDRPVWSPDGSRIAFVGRQQANWALFIARVDGSGETAFASDVYRKGTPSWSPDGTEIAFAWDLRMYVASADGSTLRQLTWGSAPAWSPDGTWIAFVPFLCGGYFGSCDVFLIKPDGGDLVRATHDQSVSTVSWSPR